jgi:serine protease Do
MPGQPRTAKRTGEERSADEPYLGLRVVPASDVAGAGDTGVVVMSLDPDGPAAEHGIEAGDVIVRVGSSTVSGAGDVRGALERAERQGKRNVLLCEKNGR